jgi:hypothetical protein
VHLDPPARIDARAYARHAGEVITVTVRSRRPKDRIRLWDCSAVDEDMALPETHVITWKSYHALHQVKGGFDRIVKDNQVAPMNHIRGSYQVGFPVIGDLLVYEEKIANQ